MPALLTTAVTPKLTTIIQFAQRRVPRNVSRNANQPQPTFSRFHKKHKHRQNPNSDI